MLITKTADYRIFFDDVRVDPFVVSWNTSLGLNAGEAQANVTMYKSKELLDWKSYLTQVRIFAKNVFSGKYTMVFEGEITDRNWDDRRSDSGKVTFNVQGFFHWLQTPIPMQISSEDKMREFTEFEYKARGIDPNSVRSSIIQLSDIKMVSKNIQQIIAELLKQMNNGYYAQVKDNSSFGWADLENRFLVFSEIDPSFRDVGFLNAVKLINNTQINTFYVYLNEILMEMMLEFFQSRDGSLVIKNAFWGDDILKNHIIDESVVDGINGFNGWSKEPTRVLAYGGVSDLTKQGEQNGQDLSFIRSLQQPVYLQLSDPEFQDIPYSPASSNLLDQGIDVNALYDSIDDFFISSTWFDNVSNTYPITSPFTGNKPRKDLPSKKGHKGTDYGIPHGTPLYNLGTNGYVQRIDYQEKGAGHYVVVRQSIGGNTYDFKYFHLSKIFVKVGDALTAGQLIANSGGDNKKDPKNQGGASTGAHLHLEIWDVATNSPLNPVDFLSTIRRAATLDSAYSTSPNSSTYSTENRSKVAAIAEFNSTIKQAAENLNIDLELAKAYLAVMYSTSTLSERDKKTKFNSRIQLEALLQSLLDVYDTILKSPRNLSNTLKKILSASDAQKITSIFESLKSEKKSYAQTGSFYSPYATTDKVDSGKKYNVNNDPNLGLIKEMIELSKVQNLETSWIEFEATAYVADCPGCTGITKTGLDVRDRTKDHRVIAVDPSVIPLYSTVEVKTIDGVSGVYRALDIGGAIKGRRIDILMNKYEDAINFGRRKVQVRVLRFKDNKSNEVKGVDPRVTNELKHSIPSNFARYTSNFVQNPGGIDPNLLLVMADYLEWRNYYESETHIGLTGFNKTLLAEINNDLIEDGNSPINIKDPSQAIYYTSLILKNYIEQLGNKLTLALAAFYMGSVNKLKGIIETVKLQQDTQFALDKQQSLNSFEDQLRSKPIYELCKMAIEREEPASTGYVDAIINNYLKVMESDYIVNDPITSASYQGFMTSVASLPSIDNNVNTNPASKIVITEEERMYKLNLRIVQQSLLRFDSRAFNTSINAYNPVKAMVEKYAKYMMKVFRAQCHTLSVNMVTCLPFLNPGFNAWIEPTRTDVVGYITQVSHRGSYAQGCYTTVQLEYLRESHKFNDVARGIFIASDLLSVADFGETIKAVETDSWKKKIEDMHNNSKDLATDAFSASLLNELYVAAPKNNTLRFGNKEYTSDELEKQIDTLYANAPDIIVKRKAKIKEVIDACEAFFLQKLFLEHTRK